MNDFSNKFRLALFNLPLIDTLDDFSSLIHLSKGLLFRLSKTSKNYYKVYQIPKSNGGVRIIRQPNYQLKAVQGWILRNILDNLSVSTASKGFEKGSGIKNNIKPHVGAKIIACFDIEDFYNAITQDKVWYIFRNAGYSQRISLLFSSLCTFDGFLPQGSPTSPKLSNLACWKLDRRIMGLTSKKGYVYTRYADDITLSAYSYSLMKIIPLFRHIIRDEGFNLNERKTRFVGPSRQQKITGLILNQNGYGINRKKYRELRALIYNLSFYQDEDSFLDEKNKLEGWLNFLIDVDEKRYKMLKEFALGLETKQNNQIKLLFR